MYGENPLKKKEKEKEKKIWIRVCWFFRSEPVSVFWSYLFTQNSNSAEILIIVGKFDSLQVNLKFEYYYVKSALECESEICHLISPFLKCFPTLKLYLDGFQSYFHDKPHSKVIIRTFKIIILNIIIPKA